MAMTAEEKVSLHKIKLSAEVVGMIVDRMDLKNIRKDTAIWMIRDRIHELNAEFEKLKLTTSANSLIE